MRKSFPIAGRFACIIAAGLVVVFGMALSLRTAMAESASAMPAVGMAKQLELPIRLAPHRAVYDLSLAEAKEETGITRLRGRMVFEFTGAACEGYAVTFRFVTEISDSEGGQRVSDLRSSSFEDGTGESFNFVTKHFLDGKQIEDLAGVAMRGEDGIEVKLTQPKKQDIPLKGAIRFPTDHLIETLKMAGKGEHFFQADVYDGSDKGDRAFQTATVIGGKTQSDVTDAELKKLPADMAKEAAWPVTLSYFDPSEGSGELLPVYELSFLLYENGISRRITMNYGDFSIHARLSELELLDYPSCGQEN